MKITFLGATKTVTGSNILVTPVDLSTNSCWFKNGLKLPFNQVLMFLFVPKATGKKYLFL